MTEQELVMEDVGTSDFEGLEGREAGPDLDVQQYEGKQVPIEKVTTQVFMSKYGIDGKTLEQGKEYFTPSIKVETIPLLKATNLDGEEYAIRASELFSLKVLDKGYPKLVEGLGKNPETFEADKQKALVIVKRLMKEKKIIWSEHDKGALRKFLKKMRVKHPKELPGKVVLIVTRAGKNDSTFLGFVKE